MSATQSWTSDRFIVSLPFLMLYLHHDVNYRSMKLTEIWEIHFSADELLELEEDPLVQLRSHGQNNDRRNRTSFPLGNRAYEAQRGTSP